MDYIVYIIKEKMEKNKMKNKNSEKYLIYILFLIIIICTIVLIIKEQQSPDYDKKEYKRVYEEYNEILKESQTINEIEEMISFETTNNNASSQLRRVACVLEIEKIDVFYPVIQETTMDNLKIAPTKLCGPEANEIGNFCIVAHNYHNEAHFSRLKELENGDIVYLTGRNGKKLKYNVYDKYEIDPKDLNCLSQETNGKKDLTLITCTNDSKRRLVVKCSQI